MDAAAQPVASDRLPPADSDGSSPTQTRRRPTSSSLHPRAHRRSRRALSAADSALEDGGGAYTTSLAGGCMTPPIDRVHRTLEAPAASACPKQGQPTDLPASLEEENEKEETRAAVYADTPLISRPATTSSSIRRRRRRLARRLASPRTVMVGGGTGHYLISPWTTEVDEEDADDEYDGCDVAKPPSSGKGHVAKLLRPASCPMDEVLASERDKDFGGVGQQEGLRRRRRSRRRRAPATSSSSLSSLASEDGKVVAKKSEREKIEEAKSALSFTAFRITYLIVHIAIMLADGLQGKSLRGRHGRERTYA
mmetsp:Transcript_44713/g.136413  ORF Transcript_44713/g.136413 Transcript_44713/m.136413 type:complete len:309 (-) Transcript_44713:13-939(-)